MATEIDRLQIEIQSNSTSAVKAIDKLTASLQKLQKVDLNKVTGGLGKLASAMGKISGSKMGKNLGKLSGTLGKIGKNTKTLGANADRAGKNVKTLFSVLSSALKAVAANALSDFVKDAYASSLEWDGIANRFGQGFGDSAQETADYIDLLSEKLYINKQEFMRYAGVFASLANGFGVVDEKVDAMAIGLTELAYDIYAYNNDVYSFEDAMTAVKSAITGELEPIRNAGIALSQAMLEETAAAKGITQSVESMTEAQKSLLRYTTMVEQAMDIGLIGTYANELKNAEGAMRMLEQQSKGLAQSLGSLFLPILTKVIPYIQAFVSLLTKAVQAVMAFFGIEFQPIDWSKYSSGVGGVADDAASATDNLSGAASAAKKLKDYTMGFDELNVINPNSGSGTSGAGAAGGGYDLPLDIESLWDQALLDSVNLKVETIAGNMMGLFQKLWTGVQTFLAPLQVIDLTPLMQSLQSLWAALQPFSAVVGQGLWWLYVNVLVPMLGWKVETALPNILNAIATALMWVVNNKDAIAAGFLAVVTAVQDLGQRLSQFAQNTSLIFHLQRIGGALRTLWTSLVELFDALRPIFAVISGVVVGLFTAIVNSLAPAIEFISSVIDIISAQFELFVGGIKQLVGFFTGDMALMQEGVDQCRQAIEKTLEGIIFAFVNMAEFVVEAVVGFVKGIISWFTNMWDVLVGHSIVPDTVEAIIEWFGKMISEVFAAVKQWVIDIIQSFSDFYTDAKDWVSGVYTAITEKWAEIWESCKTAVSDTFSAIWTNIKDTINSILGGIERMANGIVRGVNTIISALNGLSFAIPDWIPELGGKTFGFNIATLSEVSLPRLASGGLVSSGQMFIANEAGPELVGNIGNHTAVANNDQIVEAVSQGVYSAVLAAMDSRSDGSQAVNVYLDGKQIASSVEKHQKQRGKTLMGTQVYSY